MSEGVRVETGGRWRCAGPVLTMMMEDSDQRGLSSSQLVLRVLVLLLYLEDLALFSIS